MKTPLMAAQVSARTMQVEDLDAVTALEQRTHTHPWSRGNFADSLQTGYGASVYTLAAKDLQLAEFTIADQALVGYWVAMPGFEESHLLNITVAPAMRRQGVAQRMMGDLMRWSLVHRAQQIWLEVRESNIAARTLYERMGFEWVSVRKAYYPLNARTREDAIVMRLGLPT